MNLENTPGFGRVLNLLRFNLNFSRFTDCKLIDQSPDYIIEKYNHWIGFEPCSDYSGYTPDNCHKFIDSYYKRWGSSSKNCHRQLLYLHESEELHFLWMIKYFEMYIGPIEKISDDHKSGLHHLIEVEFIPKVLQLNEKNVKTILRDLKISQIF
jgi:hypothetical protein